MKILGFIAISFYFFYAGYSYSKGSLSNALWICHIGCFLVGLGLLVSINILSSIGFLLLSVGNVGWALYLLAGGELILPSILTHVGGFLIGLFVVYKNGIEAYTYLYSLIAFILLQILSRLSTDAKENVNLAFQIQEGWEKIFPSYPIYLLVIYLLLFFGFFGIEFLIQKLKSQTRIEETKFNSEPQ